MMTDTPNQHPMSGRVAWAIQPEALAVIDARSLTNLQAEQAYRATQPEAATFAVDRPQVDSGGNVAILSIRGVITPHGSPLLRMLGLGGGGLQEFRSLLRKAVADDDVSTIVLNIDSPGGLVSLVPETAAEIREARDAKPVVAVANVMAGSAAYYLASQASELVVTPSGEVGSVGVLWRHEDFSQMDARIGIKTTLISAGKFKTEGNPFEPLTDSAREHFQATVDDFYDMFVADVAAGRGVKEQAVREGYGEGRMVLAEQAVEEGMADTVATFEETLARVDGGEAAGSQASAGVPAAKPEVNEDAPPQEGDTDHQKPEGEAEDDPPKLSDEQRERLANLMLG